MNRDDFLIMAVVAGLVIVWWWRKMHPSSATSPSYSAPVVSSIGAQASTRPSNFRTHIPLTSAHGGIGTGIVAAPVRSVTGLNKQAFAAGPGTRRSAGRQSGISSRLAFTSPTWPTQQVTPTGNRAIGTGAVVVPSYTAVPTQTRGPGGVGAAWNLGAVAARSGGA